MTEQDLNKLKYPIGQYEAPERIDHFTINNWLATIKELPSKLKELTMPLSDAQLDTPYRPQGWTVRQTVHHLADSHMNSFIRFKLAVTENNPVIKPYDEASWAKLVDYTMPIGVSLILLEGIHERWYYLLQNFNDGQWEQTFKHPEHRVANPLKWWLGMYDWHCRHHYAHIKNLLERENWIN